MEDPEVDHDLLCQTQICGSNVFQGYFDDAKESRVKKIPKIQESSFKNQVSRIKIQDQDSRLKIQESREDSIKISTKKFFKTLSSTRSFHKIITKEFFSLVIDY